MIDYETLKPIFRTICAFWVSPNYFADLKGTFSLYFDIKIMEGS